MAMSFIPRPRQQLAKQKRKHPFVRAITPVLIAAFVVALGLFSLPLTLAVNIKVADIREYVGPTFPVTVDPIAKTIEEDPRVEAMLAEPPSHLTASVSDAEKAYRWLALKIADLPLYRGLAGVAGVNDLFVTVRPGQRQEQVAASFGRELGWTASERAEFIAKAHELEPEFPTGATVPGIYFASVSEPEDVALLTQERFEQEIRARYGSTTEAVVPIEDAITIASLLEREAGDWEDMRLISGVIWNRLFVGMKLQIDATLQYAESNRDKAANGWWPSVEPKDKYIKSAYNTYQNAGLPPGPIANPSIAAILAALNPKKTDCLFYFHDKRGEFHCAKDYKEHVRLLKQYYGQGR